ncbi:MAG: head-tail connector protein [Gluconobacter sp.]|uniref:head-tail connector protein n=1 Tax=Gluconobacter sp. TaxID=1876758 RepID=UPI0039E8D734
MTTLQTDGAADPLPFVALSDFKAALSIADSDASQDTTLTDLLLAASAAVESYIGRPILAADYTDHIRIKPGDRLASFALDVRPALSVSSVLRHGQLLIDPPDGWDFSPSTGVLYPPDGDGSWWGPGRYLVSYRAGWVVPGMKDPDGNLLPVTLPADIRQAVLTTARSFYAAKDRDPLLKSESEQGIGSTSWSMPDATTGGLPADAAAFLSRYLSAGFS